MVANEKSEGLRSGEFGDHGIFVMFEITLPGACSGGLAGWYGIYVVLFNTHLNCQACGISEELDTLNSLRKALLITD